MLDDVCAPLIHCLRHCTRAQQGATNSKRPRSATAVTATKTDDPTGTTASTAGTAEAAAAVQHCAALATSLLTSLAPYSYLICGACGTRESSGSTSCSQCGRAIRFDLASEAAADARLDVIAAPARAATAATAATAGAAGKTNGIGTSSNSSGKLSALPGTRAGSPIRYAKLTMIALLHW
jgi:hypothetical protein